MDWRDKIQEREFLFTAATLLIYVCSLLHIGINLDQAQQYVGGIATAIVLASYVLGRAKLKGAVAQAQGMITAAQINSFPTGPIPAETVH